MLFYPYEMIQVGYDGTPDLTPRTIEDMSTGFGSAVLLFFNTELEKEFGIGWQYTGKQMEANQCRIPDAIAERNSYKVGTKIWVQASMAKMLWMQFDLFKYET